MVISRWSEHLVTDMSLPTSFRGAHPFCHERLGPNLYQSCPSGHSPLLRVGMRLCMGPLGRRRSHQALLGGRYHALRCRGGHCCTPNKQQLNLSWPYPPPPHLCRNNEAQCPRAHDGHTAEEPVTSLVPGGLEGKHHLLVTPRSEEEGLGPGRVLGKPCPGPAFLANRPPNCSSSNHRGSKAAICSKATDGSHEGCVVCIHCDGRPCWPRTFFGFQRRIFISWD